MKLNFKSISQKVLAIVLLPAIAYGFFAILRPTAFLQIDLPIQLFNQCLTSITMAWGLSFGMLMGQMDMSVYAEQILGGVVAVLVANIMGPWGLVVGVLVVAVVIGGIKATMMAMINVKSMVLSIAYTLILGGLGFAITGGVGITVGFTSSVFGNRWITMSVFAGAGIVMYFLHKYSVFGARCSALGGNENLALSAGINKNKVEGTAIMVCSLYVAIAAFLGVARSGGATPASGLASLGNAFSAMSAVFIALALSRYISMTIGIIVGSYTMNIIVFGLIAGNISAQIKTTVNGTLLLILLIFTQLKNQRDAEKMRRAAAASLAEGKSVAGAGGAISININIPMK